jgi:Na+/H+ antiporter
VSVFLKIIRYFSFMEHLGIVLIIMAIITILAPLADRIRLPFPILLVLVGLAVGFIPGLPDVRLDPSLVFLVFLPPLLYEAASNTSWKDFKNEFPVIRFLAIRMVLLTTLILGVIIHYCIPGFSWPLAFVLGAIVSPTDAVSAMASTKGKGLPRTVTTIIEGESLVNDASALIIYRFAISLVGSLTIHSTLEGFKMGGMMLLQFFLVVAGGVGIGLAFGWGFKAIHRFVAGNAASETCLSVLVGYIAYVTGEYFHTSGVLAVVAAGLFISYRSFSIFSYQARLQMKDFWEILIFLLNGFVFTLIGLQLQSILKSIGTEHILAMTGYGLLIGVAALLVRLGILIPVTYFQPRNQKLPARALKRRRRGAIVIAWAGMRGVVSLATALALPLALTNGTAFPQRDAILYITFVVILFTIIVLGLSFPMVVRIFKVYGDQPLIQAEEQRLRLKLVDLSLTFIKDVLTPELPPLMIESLTQDTEIRQRYLKSLVDTNPISGTGAGANGPDQVSGDNGLSGSDQGIVPSQQQVIQYMNAELKIIHEQRSFIIQMHKRGTYPDEVLHKLEQELDINSMSITTQLQAVKSNAPVAS